MGRTTTGLERYGPREDMPYIACTYIADECSCTMAHNTENTLPNPKTSIKGKVVSVVYEKP
jgi:hypothetical protein